MKAAIFFLCALSYAREVPTWTHAAAPHFDIYSNATPDSARALATGLERLRAFFLRQVDVSPRPHREVRVISFATEQEYNLYRLRAGAGAFFIGAESRDYIVLPALPRGDLRTAAHEYAHVLIHSGAWTLPDWIAEGIGDVISTVQIRDRETRIGGDLPGRSRALRSLPWMSLPELFAFHLKAPPAAGREDIFYAQSWALADLLMLSPDYAPGFPTLLAALASGVPAERAFDTVYHTTLDTIVRDMRARLAHPAPSQALPPVTGPAPEIRAEPLTPFAARLILADLRFAAGDLPAAETEFRALAAERPSTPETHAALGAIALKRGDTGAAIADWKRALELDIADADLCFRYATLADERGLPARDALARAIALRPDFDDARFKLALIEKNTGHPDAAVAQLRAMRQISAKRAFAYWSVLSDAYLDLNRRAEAKEAADQARQHAVTDAERDRAGQLVWLAETEVAVEIEGKKFRTVRIPAGGNAQRNPFIETNDRAQKLEATLREVQCGDTGIQLSVDTAKGPLTLSVPDPSRVQIRNAGTVSFEFVCGPQEPRKVLVEFAPGPSILRGLEFR